MPLIRTRYVSAIWLLSAITVVWPAAGQQCYLQQDCPAGYLCSPDQSCKPVRDVLGANGTIFWVDQSVGNDNNSGSEANPWKTIQRATGEGVLQPGDAVVVRAGTYYGAIEPKSGGTVGNRITYAAYPGDEVIVSGAIPYNESWSPDGSAYKATWPYDPMWVRRVNDGHEQDDDARRRDMVVADGQVLTPVYTRADVVPGTFFLQGSPDNPNTLFVELEGGKNPANATIEVSLSNSLFNPSNAQTYCNTGGNIRGYFHLIGFTFRHTANEAQNGAVCSGDEGSLIENVTVEWTNGAGFLISGDGHVVRGVSANYNGMSGIRGEACHQCLLEFSSSSGNNWKNYNPFWESGGGKWLYTTESTFRHLTYTDNNGPGLWLDMDNFDNIVENSRFDSNYGVNLFVEFTSNRNTVRNNVMTRARYARPAFYGYGLLIHAADDNVVLHNTMMANEGGAMRIRADHRGAATGNRYYNNLFVANAVIQPGTDHKASELSFEEHANITQARTNKGDGNVFWKRNYASPEYNTFQLRSKDLTGGNVLRSSTLSNWQGTAQTDWSSMVLNTALPHVADTTDHLYGWRLSAESQVIGKAVALPADVAAVSTDYFGQTRPATQSDVGAHQYTPGQTPPPDPFVFGDASGNGIVTALDASLILQHASGLANLEAPGADASGDGLVTAYDASLVLQFITGFIGCFPPEGGCAGKERF